MDGGGGGGRGEGGKGGKGALQDPLVLQKATAKF